MGSPWIPAGPELLFLLGCLARIAAAPSQEVMCTPHIDDLVWHLHTQPGLPAAVGVRMSQQVHAPASDIPPSQTPEDLQITLLQASVDFTLSSSKHISVNQPITWDLYQHPQRKENGQSPELAQNIPFACKDSPKLGGLRYVLVGPEIRWPERVASFQACLCNCIMGSALSPQSCKENQFYDATSQKCCYQCQPGFIPKIKCPMDPGRECRKRCPPDQYLNRKLSTPRCEACMSCPLERDLVEKAPCTDFSDRVCVCRPGMRCESVSPNACSLCVPVTPRTTSKMAFGVSTADSHDFTLVGASVLCFIVLCAALLILWQRRTFKKWIVPQQANLSDQAKCCAKRIRRLSLEEKGEGGDPAPLESPEESPDDESSLLEVDAGLGPDPEGAELGQAGNGGLLDPPLLSHTSNCIEKIYIMRADTVIVGSVSEVPAGKTPTREEEGGAGAQEEGELVARYPEQETEFCPASSVTTPVEEEWQFQPCSEKALAI
ncbi:hypothetical protein lerEdw1_003153 [Lerista edwardsae]|nr:hypothetical protein lerEdw1_003153 [Lerista edwardsae]